MCIYFMVDYFCCLASPQHELILIMVNCVNKFTRKCTVCLTITFQGYHHYDYLVGQCRLENY